MNWYNPLKSFDVTFPDYNPEQPYYKTALGRILQNLFTAGLILGVAGIAISLLCCIPQIALIASAVPGASMIASILGSSGLTIPLWLSGVATGLSIAAIAVSCHLLSQLIYRWWCAPEEPARANNLPPKTAEKTNTKKPFGGVGLPDKVTAEFQEKQKTSTQQEEPSTAPIHNAVQPVSSDSTTPPPPPPPPARKATSNAEQPAAVGIPTPPPMPTAQDLHRTHIKKRSTSTPEPTSFVQASKPRSNSEAKTPTETHTEQPKSVSIHDIIANRAKLKKSSTRPADMPISPSR